MNIYEPNVNDPPTAHRLPGFTQPILGNEHTDQQMQMGDTGLLEFQHTDELNASLEPAREIHAHLSPAVTKVNF
jgi:hypothetical protein